MQQSCKPLARHWAHVGGCQTEGPFLGTLNIRCRTTVGAQKRDRNLDNHSRMSYTRNIKHHMSKPYHGSLGPGSALGFKRFHRGLEGLIGGKHYESKMPDIYDSRDCRNVGQPVGVLWESIQSLGTSTLKVINPYTALTLGGGGSFRSLLEHSGNCVGDLATNARNWFGSSFSVH